ncbi:MAG: hypothetical protein JWO10_799 [Microbacteriaceae bacterium]|nr:hypothetical protein [Microbacteriaceae bacterium]
MTRRTILTGIALALPAVMLAVVGITHPIHLTAQTAEYWRNLHIAILPIFPLLGFAPWLLVRGHDAFVTWLAGILGFVYAAFYTGLDVLAGIGAGGLKLDDMGMATGTVFGLGNGLGRIGSIALVAACLVVALDSWKGYGSISLPGSAFSVVGSLLFLQSHIYAPWGVVGQLCLAIGWLATFAVTQRSLRRVAVQVP